MTSKISHFVAIGLLIGSGYALSLGSEGRSQVVAIFDVVGEATTHTVDQVATIASEIAGAVSDLSFANVYSALGVLTGAMSSTDGRAAAYSISEGIVVEEQAIDAATAAEQEAKIQATFSDKVKVQPDATKKSGTITPVFKSGAGETYRYMIVPVNE